MVSVIIPIYNRELTIERCIESVISQSYSNIEIILVDDGSTDKSGEICDSYAKKDDRVKVFHIDNSGVSNARNFGINMSHGDYISFLDSDDYLDNKYIEKLYSALMNGNNDVSMCNVCEIRGERSIPRIDYSDDISASKLIKDFFYGITKGLFSWGKLYKKTIIKYLFEPYKYCEDVLFVYENLRESNCCISVVKEALYYYVRQPESTTMKNEYNALLDMDRVAVRIIDESKSPYESYLNPAYSAIVNWSFYMYFSAKNLNETECTSLRKKCIDNISTYRKMVLADAASPAKTRIASAISYISMNMLEIIYKHLNH